MGTMLTCENLRAWMEPLAHKLSEGELARAGCYQRGWRTKEAQKALGSPGGKSMCFTS
eukprot:CAMPEP_0181178700 /NCGR_PEP_ID=MMETSP1096-20121128/5857_1 /TAXON_ID=156174 ORGANISM="Chrysochromulina ericina, Strain CCMP281" /NCGR_SAMPLE_ID=MMETSP1096 /ASSEMBLY_ACC=CAM_ASM_000453 /LENGTH=57 /DNA_ID=CAMNT_0023266981 /DNA_START=274 /DNA_END=444 /DNA_ORIENTATION=+